jgi:hypothetical protein
VTCQTTELCSIFYGSLKTRFSPVICSLQADRKWSQCLWIKGNKIITKWCVRLIRLTNFKTFSVVPFYSKCSLLFKAQ